jgi:hypothetical protein
MSDDTIAPKPVRFTDHGQAAAYKEIDALRAQVATLKADAANKRSWEYTELDKLRDQIVTLKAELSITNETNRQWGENLTELADKLTARSKERDALLNASKLDQEAIQDAVEGRQLKQPTTFEALSVEELRKERDALNLKLEARIDCHAGPGTTEPACGACSECLTGALAVAEEECHAFKALIESLKDALVTMAPAIAVLARVNEVSPEIRTVLLAGEQRMLAALKDYKCSQKK